MYDEINFEKIEDGMSIHILHIGSYDEAQSFEKMDEFIISKGVYRWAKGSTLGSYFVSATASHYDWAMKKLKAHQKNCKSKKSE